MKIPALLLVAVLPALAAAAEVKKAQPAQPKAPDVGKLDPAMGAGKKAADANIEWHDVTKFGVEGREWADMERHRYFDRLPKAAEGKVTPAVWSLSRDSAGMVARFKTDAPAIHARYKLMKPDLEMPHMPATGVSGLDLYARDADGKWKWVQVSRPAAQTVSAQLISDLAPRRARVRRLPAALQRSGLAGDRSAEGGDVRGPGSAEREAARVLWHVHHPRSLRFTARHGAHRDPGPPL